MTYQNYLFDFDGTLVDSLEVGRLIFNQFAQKNKLEAISKAELVSLKNCSLKEFLKRKKISKTKFLIFMTVAKLEMKKRILEIPLISGYRELLPELRKKANFIGILTSNSKENVQLFLKEHHLSSFFDRIESTQRLLGKSKYINHICTQHSLQKHETLYIGDEIRDIKASYKSGISVAAVSWGFNSTELLKKHHPHHFLHHPTDLLHLSLF